MLTNRQREDNISEGRTAGHSMRKDGVGERAAPPSILFVFTYCARSARITLSDERPEAVLAMRLNKQPLFVSPTQRSTFARDGEGSSEEVSSQGALTNTLLPPRGFRDFPPGVLAIHKHIFTCWHEVAAEFGFKEYKGPSVERYSLYSQFCRSVPAFASSARIENSSEEGSSSPAVSVPPHIYRLQVGGPESLCLRPELTPSLYRMLQREQQQHPSGIARRWYSVERVWRHEKPGCGRRREHFQWNLDIALPSLQGRNSLTTPDIAHPSEKTRESQGHKRQQTVGFPAADFCSFATAELIAAAVRLLQKLGLSSRDVRIRVGSRSLLRDLLWTEEELRNARTSSSFPHSARQRQKSDNEPLPYRTAQHFPPTDDGCIFKQRLTTAMQVLDRAYRRTQEETEIALADGLGITVEKSRCVLQRILSFDINSDSMVRELNGRLQRLGRSDGMQHTNEVKLDDKGSERPSDGGGLHSDGLPTSVKDLQCVVHLLREGYGIGDWVDVDLLIVRGLHYYTGVVFEAFDSEGLFRAILGGGCYGEADGSLPGTGTTAEGRSISTENPTVPKTHLDTQMLNNRVTVRAPVTGVGLGMGDCVLMELLQRKGLLPFSGPTVDVIVALRQNRAAQHRAGEVMEGSFSYAPSESQRLPDTDYSINDCSSTPSTTGTSHRHYVVAQQLCCKLRDHGLRVELLLPPSRSERAALKHARSVGARAVIFVAERPQQFPGLEKHAKMPRSEDVSPLSAGAHEATKAAEFKVFLNPENSEEPAPLGKQYETCEPNGAIPLSHHRTGFLKRATTATTIPSVIKMLEAHLCLPSQGRGP
ncbi:histidyl-tRNA synthetase, putative [Eimeria brunetti]|uniref:histidine--tRNA ligase n=1 Tax=Eimeria brunetti TaxID=51314 RepID=U6LR30_9EIME|nr:histidyl-tRNA synthetase, putative [Eimeria brunetti]